MKSNTVTKGVDRDPANYDWYDRMTEDLQAAYADLNTAKDTILDLAAEDPNKLRGRVLRRLVADIDDLMTQIEEML